MEKVHLANAVGKPRWLILVLVTFAIGVASGLGGITLALLLRLVQRMAYGHGLYTIVGRVSFLHEVTAHEAADAGLLSPELAAGISRVKGVKQLGFHAGNWLSADECAEVLRIAYGSSLRAKRDYAMLAILFGCGLRRSELVGLELDDIQIRQGHWAIVDLIGKGGHIRTVPVPVWAKVALDGWIAAAGITEGKIFRAVARTGKMWGVGISQNVVWYVVKGCCERAGLQHIAPHDLRRTCAKLCHTNGGEIEQIQFLLGHASVQTTERYLGCKQNLGHPVNDLFQLRNIAVATQASLWCETDGLTTETGRTPLDKISINESRCDQEGSDKRAGTSFRGNGHASV